MASAVGVDRGVIGGAIGGAMGKISEICEGESSESETETESGKPFHRRISTNREIKCSVSKTKI